MDCACAPSDKMLIRFFSYHINIYLLRHWNRVFLTSMTAEWKMYRSITHLQQFNCLELSSKATKSSVLADILSCIAVGHHLWNGFCRPKHEMQRLFLHLFHQVPLLADHPQMAPIWGQRGDKDWVVLVGFFFLLSFRWRLSGKKKKKCANLR